MRGPDQLDDGSECKRPSVAGSDTLITVSAAPVSVTDSGLQSLLLMASLHGVAADAAQLTHEFGPESFTTRTILLAAKVLGLSAKLVQQAPSRLGTAPWPAIALARDGRFFIVGKVDQSQPERQQVLIQ